MNNRLLRHRVEKALQQAPPPPQRKTRRDPFLEACAIDREDILSRCPEDLRPVLRAALAEYDKLDPDLQTPLVGAWIDRPVAYYQCQTWAMMHGAKEPGHAPLPEMFPRVLLLWMIQHPDGESAGLIHTCDKCGLVVPKCKGGFEPFPVCPQPGCGGTPGWYGYKGDRR